MFVCSHSTKYLLDGTLDWNSLYHFDVIVLRFHCSTGSYFADEWEKLFITFCSLVSCGENEDETLQRMDYKG